MTPENRNKHRQTIAIEAHRDAPRQGQLGLVYQGLHLHGEATAALDGDVHAGTGGGLGVTQEQLRRVGNAAQAGGRHLEGCRARW